jgi:aminoglycoside phosphotransferase (APT) family kinase protein
VLSHGDFNTGNVLWFRGKLSGVVDWETAESAPPGADVGACMFDLAVLAGPETSEAFLEGYGREVKDLWFWELVTALKFLSLYREWLPVWRSFGLKDIDQTTVRRRIDAGIRDALNRAT